MASPSGLATKFRERFGTADSLQRASAPGRVNLIGEHTDYNGGFVLPMAIDKRVQLVFRPRDEGPVRLWSESYAEWDEFDLDGIGRVGERPWANFPRGVARVLQEAGHGMRPMDALILGDVPVGAGLSSSAAIEVASALAFCQASGLTIKSRELALLCQRAENTFVGVNCGIMDQFVSLHAGARQALLLDCRSLEHRLVPLDTSEVSVMVCNTMVHHEMGSSEYNLRRATCEKAAEALGHLVPDVRQLRDVDEEMLAEHAGALDPVSYRRARHVVTEDARVMSATRALESGDYAAFGRFMNESHESLRDDYEVSCDELDLMVEIARRQDGTLGARMTGGGFGGCTVNLVQKGALDAFRSAVAECYRRETGIEPETYDFEAAGGAEVSTVT